MPVLEQLVETPKEKRKERHIKVYNHLRLRVKALIASEVRLRESLQGLPSDTTAYYKMKVRIQTISRLVRVIRHKMYHEASLCDSEVVKSCKNLNDRQYNEC